MEVNIQHVHAHLLKLIELAEHGEEVVIAREGEAVVKIVAVPSKPKRKLIGSARGKIWVFDDANSPEMNREIEEFLNSSPLFSEEEH
jgi:antitoxin (DNA-binding transcriptional repressor) of toxin-antitoxin stability system